MNTVKPITAMCALAFMAGLSQGRPDTESEKPATPPLNPRIEKMKVNEWVKLHEQKADDTVRFKLQGHGGSCFDSKRGRLILFGSDTHSRDWKNSPFFFNVADEKWSVAYPEDPKETYKVNDEGIPVAGKNGNHPWAMHTFGCVIYDVPRDEMVIVCYPAHMRPDKWGHAVKHLWGKIKRHPNWTFDCSTHTWRPLPCEPRHFFPHCAAMDTDRHVLIGCAGGKLAELSGEPRSWKSVKSKRFFGWHDNCVYDSKEKALVIFGTNRNANDIVIYKPATGEQTKMPTPGKRPPKDQHNPMCFNEGIGQTVIVVDRTPDKDGAEKSTAETWCYDLERDAWTQIPSATLPFACGMNYNMEYDPNHKVCLLVARAPGKFGSKTVVFALKPDPANLQ